MNEKLWTKNFTIMMIGTIISAIGGVGLSLALSVTVYDNTASTLLTGLYSAITIMPSVVMPLFIGPLIDRYSRKKIIVGSDALMGFVFLLFTLLIRKWDFNYYIYVAIGIIINVNGVIYMLAYESLFPNLIPKGRYQKGYSIATLIYPLTNVLVLPVATLVFQNYGVAALFLAEGVFLLIASAFEFFIDFKEEFVTKKKFEPSAYQNDIKEGLQYLIQEKGIWSVYLFFVVMMFSDGISVLVYPFFEKSATLSIVNYSLLLSLQSGGYMFGGFFHYFVKLPTEKRFLISIAVYSMFAVLGGLFFFMPFYLMLVSKFLLGFGGMNSANIRVSSINHYIRDEMRGRINAVYHMLVSIAMISGRLVAGWLGEFLAYPLIAILYGIFILLGIYFFIMPNRQEVKVLYNREV